MYSTSSYLCTVFFRYLLPLTFFFFTLHGLSFLYYYTDKTWIYSKLLKITVMQWYTEQNVKISLCPPVSVNFSTGCHLSNSLSICIHMFFTYTPIILVVIYSTHFILYVVFCGFLFYLLWNKLLGEINACFFLPFNCLF